MTHAGSAGPLVEFPRPARLLVAGERRARRAVTLSLVSTRLSLWVAIDASTTSRVAGRSGRCRPLSRAAPRRPGDHGAVAAAMLASLSAATGAGVTLRSRVQVRRFFAGMDLVAPGVVWAPQWRPDSRGDVGRHPRRCGTLVGVARRR